MQLMTTMGHTEFKGRLEFWVFAMKINKKDIPMLILQFSLFNTNIIETNMVMWRLLGLSLIVT